MKKAVTICLVFYAIAIYAQRIDTQQVFVATSEAEVYELFNQMLDSARVSNRFLEPSGWSSVLPDGFGFGILREIENRDTLMKFIQSCRENPERGFVCNRVYWGYISNSMPIDFYGRFLNHLRQLDVLENHFIKREINQPLLPVMRIIKRQYESGELNEQDSAKARQLIEETMLRLINDDHSYWWLASFHEYVTDTIRQALINVLENPFFPEEYLDFFMSQQDTLHLDITDIPDSLRVVRRVGSTPEERVYFRRFERFQFYEELGEVWGLSAGEAYLERRRRFFKDWIRETGFLPIRSIARYAYEKNDELLIKHLKKFRERFPDFALEHF